MALIFYHLSKKTIKTNVSTHIIHILVVYIGEIVVTIESSDILSNFFFNMIKDNHSIE